MGLTTVQRDCAACDYQTVYLSVLLTVCVLLYWFRVLKFSVLLGSEFAYNQRMQISYLIEIDKEATQIYSSCSMIRKLHYSTRMLSNTAGYRQVWSDSQGYHLVSAFSFCITTCIK